MLADLIPDSSRSAIKRHIEQGAVTVDEQPPPKGAKTIVRAGSVIRYQAPPPEPVDLVAEDIPVPILFEDEHLVVVDKPAGLVVHPAAGHPSGTLVNALLHHLQKREGADTVRPGIVHRLDRDTTGVMVVAKTESAERKLAAQFKARTVKKVYLAITLGVPKPESDRIETLFGRHPRNRLRFTSHVMQGKTAITNYRIVEPFVGAALLEVRIETGRTHQIRVHLAERGHPLIGDALYRGRRGRGQRGPAILAIDQAFGRPALLAKSLSFDHPDTGERLSFEAPTPPDFEALLDQLRALRRS